MRAIMSSALTRLRSRSVTMVQQLVAGGMAERIVDLLEVVEVEKVPGDHGSGLGMAKRLLQPLANSTDWAAR